MMRARSIGVFIFGLGLNISAADIKVTIVEKGAERWTADELTLIQKAADTAFNRITTANAVTCALRNSFRPKIVNSMGKAESISKDKLRLMWEKQTGALNKSRTVSIEIDKSALGKKILGMAEVGIAHTNRETYELTNIKISIDQIKIAEALRGKSQNASDVWINTIAHEVAHTFGHLHGSDANADWESNYAGYFPTELGFCVMSNGAYGSDLGNNDLYRKRKEHFHFN